MLRQALDDVQKIDRMTPPFSDKSHEYFVMMNTFQDPKEVKLLLQYASRPANNGSGYGVSGIVDDIRLWGSEPSSRIQDLFAQRAGAKQAAIVGLISNILAHCDDLPSRRPPKAEPPLPLFQTNAGNPRRPRFAAERNPKMV